MRGLFEDGLNSAAHVGLGAIAGKDLVIPFLIYQFILQRDNNATVDSAEFFVGWLLASLFSGKR